MQTSIIIFLAIATALLAICLTLVTCKYMDLKRDAKIESEYSENKIKLLKDEKRELLMENVKLIQTADDIEAKNDELKATIAEMKEITKTLMQDNVIDTNVGRKSLLPSGHTNTYRCEDYHLFNPVSKQAYLQQECYTDGKTGIRVYENKGDWYYCAAMGTAYGIEIGQAYRVKLKCGTEFTVIMGDFKHPIDNVQADDYGDADKNYDNQDCTCVIEFIVDMSHVPYKVKQAGTMSALSYFGGLYGDGGDIVEITDIGKVW